jgi:hypothetical protein
MVLFAVFNKRRTVTLRREEDPFSCPVWQDHILCTLPNGFDTMTDSNAKIGNFLGIGEHVTALVVRQFPVPTKAAVAYVKFHDRLPRKIINF